MAMSATSDLRLGGVRHWLSNKLNRARGFAQFLYVQRVAGFSVSDTPAFEAGCAPFFLELLDKAETYLEFGTGGSTVLAATNGVRFVSVESDKSFLNAVKQKIRDIGRFDPNRQTYIAADIGLTEAWGAPVMHRATPTRLKKWRTYPHAPWATMERMPGPFLVLVDGRFRVACALMAARFLKDKQGHILIDDYGGRDHYRAVERHLELKQRRGRMALFTPRADVKAGELDADIETYCADWR